MGLARIAVIFIFVLNVAVTKKITYNAAVVEYGGDTSPKNFKESLFNNMREYRWLLSAAAKQKVDIVVFPEGTLNYVGTTERKLLAQFAFEVPEPSKMVAPCGKDSYGNELSELSCVVKESNLYAVINVVEKVKCNPGSRNKKAGRCQEDGVYLYNTNVVFDREGRIISRYRKINLFGVEKTYVDQTDPEPETFKTDFGVEFGHIICFDSLFDMPVQNLRQKGIRNFVFPLMWFSELPFLTAVQFQSAWSQSYESNLLASGASIPSQGSTGSGIFAGKSGTKSAMITGSSEAKLMVAEIYADPETKSEESFKVESVEPENVRLMRDQLEYYDWNFVDLTKSASGYNQTVCSDDFCCYFYIKTKESGVSTTDQYRYAMVAFDGVRSFAGKSTGGVQNCGLIACKTEEFDSCGIRSSTTKSGTVFENLTISAAFATTKATQFPVSLTTNLLPLSTKATKFTKSANIIFELVEGQSDLLTFGIFGRKFDLDGQPVSKKSPVLEAARKSRNLLGITETEIQSNSSTIEVQNTEQLKDIIDNTVSYIWGKLRIVLIVLTIYVLEMM